MVVAADADLERDEGRDQRRNAPQVVGGDAQGWPADAEILYPEEGYCHGHIDTWPDHRPMAATFTAIGR